MQNVPKIVRDRLQASQSVVHHPDADLLTAFAEQSLPADERAVVFEHLARCGACRDVVALALPETEELQVGASAVRRAWLTWPVLRWGFVAAGVVIVASLGVLRHQRPSDIALYKGQSAQVARQDAPAQMVAAAPAVPAAKQDTATVGRLDPDKFYEAPKAPSGSGELKAASPAVPPLALSRPLPKAASGAFGRSVGGPIQPSQSQLNNNNQMQQQHDGAPTQPLDRPATNQTDQISSDEQAPAANEAVSVASAGPATNTEGTRLEAQSRDQYAGSEVFADKSGVSKTKLPVTPANAGQIAGYVLDPSGAVVANARITVTPTTIGKSATAVTDSRGEFLIAGLPTGNYKAQAQAPGFSTTVLDWNYDASRPSSYSFTLNPGSVSETVEVSAQSAQLEADSSTSAASVANNMVGELPVNGRNFGRLARWTVSASGALQRSVDQGKSWQTVNVNASPVSSASMEIVASESRAKAVSKEKDADKKLSKREIASPVFRAVTAAGSEVWAGGSAGALYHSVDAGTSWTRVVPASAGTVLTDDVISLEFNDSQNGRVSTSTGEVWTTSDAGHSWRRQ